MKLISLASLVSPFGVSSGDSVATYEIDLEDASTLEIEDGSALLLETTGALGTCPTALYSQFLATAWPDPSRAILTVL